MHVDARPAVRIRPSPEMTSVDGPITQRRVHAVGDVGVAGPAEGDDPAVAEPDVGPDDAPVVEDDRVGDDGVGRALGAACVVPWAIDSRIDLPPPKTASSPPKVRSCSTSIHRSVSPRRTWSPDGRSVQRGVRRAGVELSHRPRTWMPGHACAARAARRSATSREAPGSKRRDVPDGMSSRNPCAASRSKSRAALASRQVQVRADLHRPVAGVDDDERARARRRSRSALSSRVPAAQPDARPGPRCGAMVASSGDRVVEGDELAAVRERRLDLHLGEHLGDPRASPGRAVSTSRPASISSATPAPSRARSITQVLSSATVSG